MSLGKFRRVVLIVLDGVGIGAAADAEHYGDLGANTVGHVLEKCGGLDLPNLSRLGLERLMGVSVESDSEEVVGAYGRMCERSAGKDTTTGHWELAGIIQEEPFATFPEGFPQKLIDDFVAATGLEVLGNIAASGTDIVRRLGEEHMRTGRPIVYTSADSVFQIAAHEEVIPVERLYEICSLARRLLDPYRVGRVIARPFVGSCADNFKRTARRHDFSMPPTARTVLDLLLEHGLGVFGIGKIRDIYCGRGLSDYLYTESNADGMNETLRALSSMERGLVFTNLVDFDMLFGHRLDAEGFGNALEEFDRWLPRLFGAMDSEDLLLITADHGCDPTTPGTDHSREDVPLFAWHRRIRTEIDLGWRRSFADVASTLAEAFGLPFAIGESFLEVLDLERLD